MAMIGKVLRMHHRENKSVREIARATSLSRNTVRKYLRVPVAQPPKYVRRAASTKLTPFIEMVEMALLADARRPRKERRTARALLQQIAAAGYEGGYTQLTDFIRAWRAQQGSVAVGKAFVPLAFELGEAFQFDWSDEALVIGGIYRKLQVAHMKLCASRAFWLVAYPSQGHEMLFDAHTRSFAALGGVARRGIYDNMKTAVDKVHKGKGRTVNARFSVMCAHYLYDPDFCNVASGWEKGVVEKNVQDSRRRIWIDARERRFASFDELNAWLGERCRALWQEVRHPEHNQFSIAEMLEHERGQLNMHRFAVRCSTWRFGFASFASFGCMFVWEVECARFCRRQQHDDWPVRRRWVANAGAKTTISQMPVADLFNERGISAGRMGFMASTTKSFSREELEAWAKQHAGLFNLDLTRLSSVLLGQLLAAERTRSISVFSVTDELQAMEGLRPAKATGADRPFSGKVLKGLRKKHFTDPRFMTSNLAAQFAINKGGNARLTKVVERAFEQNTSGVVDDQFGNVLAHYGILEALKDRAAGSKLTGEWIVFHQHRGANYYLTLGAHTEGDTNILKRVRLACSFDELPFAY